MRTTFCLSNAAALLRRPLRALGALWLLATALVPAMAQPVSSLGVVSVNIRADVWWQNWTCDSALSLSIDSMNGTRTASAHVCDPVDQSLVFDSQTNQILARLVPGRTYYLNANAYGTSGFTVHAIPDPGYTLEIENVPSQQVTIGWDGWYNLRLRIRPPDEGGTGLRAGMATALGNDRILWQLALGSLANGDSAGSLTFVDLPWLPVSNTFKAYNLTYDAPSSDVWVRKNPTGVTAPNVAGAIRQVIAPQVCVDVVQTSETSMEMKVYHRAQLGTESGGFFSFTGDPFAWYLIQRDGTDANAVRIQCDLRDLPNSSASGLPVVRSNVTRLVRGGSAPNYTWTASDWHQNGQTPLSERVRVRNGGTDTFTAAAPGQSGNPASYATRTHTNKPWGEEVATETIGSTDAVTTSFTYWEPEAVGEESALYARVRSRSTTGGAWEGYEYYDYEDGAAKAGQVRRRHGPFNNSDTSVPPNLGQHGGEVTEFDYANDPFGRASWPTSIETKVNGTTIAKAEIAYSSAALNYAWNSYLQVVTATRKDYSSSASFLTTVTKYFREDAGTQAGRESDAFFRNRVHSITRPDGVKQSYAYQRGTWNGSSFTLSGNGGLDPVYGSFASRTTVITGSATTGTVYSSHNGYPIDEVRLVSGKSSMHVTIYDTYARAVRTESYIYNGSAWQFISSNNFQWNLSNQIVKRASNESTSYNLTSGAIHESSYTGDFLLSETDESGVTISYTYDVAGRTETATKAAATGIGALTTKYTYDTANRVTGEQVGVYQNGAFSGESMAGSREYDTAGRIKKELAPGPNGVALQTIYGYNPSAREVIVTLPNGGTRKEVMQADGSLREISGTAVVPEYHTYSVDASTGERWSRANIGAPPTQFTDATLWDSSSVRQTLTKTDWLQRRVRAERAGFAGQAAFVEQAEYHPGSGRPKKTIRTGLADTLHEDNAPNQPVRSGLDLNGNNALDLGAVDRVSDEDRYAENIGGGWWLTTVTRSYPTDGTPLTVAIARKRLTNFSGSLTGFAGILMSEEQATDVDGTTTTVRTFVDRASKTTKVERSTSALSNKEVETLVNGLPVDVTRFDGLTYSVTYDALHRRSTSNDPRTGGTTTHYKPGTKFVHGVWGRIDVNGTFNYLALYTYDNAGRVIAVADAHGKITRTEYNTRDQIVRRWGNATNPVEFGYNTYGERITMRTYRGGTGWAGISGSTLLDWPGTGNNAGANPGTGDWTRWVYDPASGLLKEKYDAANLNAAGDPIGNAKKVSYTYNVRGQTAKRTWARGVEATYAYYGDNAGELRTGELKSVSYSDGTPGVTYNYTRSGQLYTVADTTGTRTLSYGTAAGSHALQLDTITLPFYANGGTDRVLTRKYDSAKRPNGLWLGTAGSPSADLAQIHAYSGTNGRFDGLTTASSAEAARTFTYSYYQFDADPAKPRAPLVAGYSTGSFAVSRTYEPYRDLLTTIQGKWGAATRTSYEYTYNALGQRATAKQSGDAFADLGASTYYRYAYSDKGEVTEAVNYFGTDVTNTNAPQLVGRRFGFGYDNVGNRQTATRSLGTSVSDTYWPNALNQYTQRENDVTYAAGTAKTTSAIQVSGGTATATVGRADRYWGAEVTLSNTSAPAAANLTISATLAGNPTLVATQNRAAYLAQSPQAFAYDDDGNMIRDGLWVYVWDAENRLTNMFTCGAPEDPQAGSAPNVATWNSGVPRKKLEFRYDYLGRRVQKRAWQWSGNAWSVTTERRFLYDGWDPVAEFNAPGGTSCGSLVRSYTWGLDLAGSLTATGGVGGLVQITDHTGTPTSYFPTYDGNGNVASLVRASDGVVAAKYEYSPFGELLRMEGSYAASNPFRFSTKFTDDESGLVYYGHRYYSASLGRFINRDPIEEEGGLNLYGFCGNDGINEIDVLGQNIFKKIGKFFSKAWKVIKRPLITAVLAAIPYAGPYLVSAYLAVDGYQNGGLKGALINVATYWATQGIGKHFGHNPSSFNLANEAQRAVAHGLVGGTASALQGGSFKSGFFAGAVGSFGGSLLGMTDWGRSLPGNGFVRNVIGTAAFAGLGSTLGGGSFSRGFETGLMIGLFNHYGDDVLETFQAFSLGVIEGATGLTAGDGSTGSEHGDLGRTVGLWTGRVAGLAGVGKAVFSVGRKLLTRGAIQTAEKRLAPEIGRKLDYLLGRATGNAHNIARSTQMLKQLQSIGLHDTPATRQLLARHLDDVLNNSSNILRTEGGRVVRESLLMGPQGGVKLETIWEGTKFITVNVFGGKL